MQAAKVIEKIVTHPAFLLSNGNICLTVVNQNLAAFLLQVSATVLIAIAIANASAKNKPIILPFWILGALNLASAMAVAVGGSDYFVIAALAGWGLGHFASALEISCTAPHKASMFFYGLADIFAIYASAAMLKFPAAFAVIGTISALLPQRYSAILPPSRFLAFGYLASAVLSLGAMHWQMATAYALWAAGYFAFEPERNQRFVQNLIAGKE